MFDVNSGEKHSKMSYLSLTQDKLEKVTDFGTKPILSVLLQVRAF